MQLQMVHILLSLQVTIPECGVAVEKRFQIGHSAIAIQKNPSHIEDTIFGGCLDLEFIRSS